jgi:hypothetical protein
MDACSVTTNQTVYYAVLVIICKMPHVIRAMEALKIVWHVLLRLYVFSVLETISCQEEHVLSLKDQRWQTILTLN